MIQNLENKMELQIKSLDTRIETMQERFNEDIEEIKEEIGSVPEKEFRIMIVKMIQSLENKMELQIKSLETTIEKMQEMFNGT